MCQIETDIQDFCPSVNKLRDKVLFSFIDHMVFDRVTGKGKQVARIEIKGDFINLQLCAAQSPFLSILTTITPSNGCKCITVADDMRDQTKESALVGIAVMHPQSISSKT